MSAAWDLGSQTTQSEKSQKKFIRMWGYLSVAGVFLIYVAHAVGVNPF